MHDDYSESSYFDAFGYSYGSFFRKDKPIFKISIKPRAHCHDHLTESKSNIEQSNDPDKVDQDKIMKFEEVESKVL